MPDNLRITTPISTTEGINKASPAGETPQINPVDPRRVPKTNVEEDRGGQASDLLLNRNSVYDQFVQQLQQTPGLEQTLEKLLSDAAVRQAAATAVPGTSGKVLSTQLQALLDAVAVQEDGVLEDITSQRGDSTLFTGPLFKLLNQISAQSKDAQFDLRLADFLKAYTGYKTAPDATQAILANLKELKHSIPAMYAKPLSEAMEKLSQGKPEDGARYVNSDLPILKKEIIPLLSKYVTKTNDYGKSRDVISLLLHNTAVLNESSGENLAAKFDQLYHYCKETLSLPEMTTNLIQELFSQDVTGAQPKKASAFLHELTSLLAQTSEQKSSPGIDRAALSDIAHSLLLDSSVFMPFQHIFLPAMFGGRFLFAQIWVEKQDPDESRKGLAKSSKMPKNLFLTFEIQDLGYFEASVHLTGREVNMKLACPPTLKDFHGEIRSGVSEILKKNGFEGDVRLSACAEPTVPKIILQKIQERKHAVDVTI